MKIVTIVGARPQFIKAAVVSRAINEKNNEAGNGSIVIEEIIVHTGQHYDQNMSDVFFEEMHIPTPDYFLNINGLSHGAMTGQMLEQIESVLQKEIPDVVLVYGDTNSTLAGALAASKLHIPVAHVEAGLRSYNRNMPEEINRVLTDHVSTFLFCPTKQAIENLKEEGIINKDGNHIKSFPNRFQPDTYLVGDVMLDAAKYYKQSAKKPKFKLPEKYILATIHRAENTDISDRLKSIFQAFIKISKEIPIILPLHPRTMKFVKKHNIQFSDSDIYIIEPVSYLEMVYMLERCKLVMTDSGGLQKEAFFFSKPCITLRDETEWVELVDHGYNIVTGSDTENIYKTCFAMLDEKITFDSKLYGNGDTGKKIVNVVVEI